MFVIYHVNAGFRDALPKTLGPIPTGVVWFGGTGAVLAGLGAQGRRRHQGVPTAELAYAQHVYKAQGLTAKRAFVLTGGWQTDREHAYVPLTRARKRTDVYISREDLGEQGLDTGAIDRLGNAIAQSNAQRASITRKHAGVERETGSGRERDRGRAPRSEAEASAHDSERSQETGSAVARTLREQQERERDRGHDLGWGIE